MLESGRIAVRKPEQIVTISTDANQHFTDALAYGEYEKESLSGLLSNKINIVGVNIQSMQNLKYRLAFFSNADFDSTDLNKDSWVSDVLLDLSSSISPFQLGGAGQWRLDIGALDIPLTTTNYTLYIALKNESATPKLAGSAGAVQIDIKYSLRL